MSDARPVLNPYGGLAARTVAQHFVDGYQAGAATRPLPATVAQYLVDQGFARPVAEPAARTVLAGPRDDATPRRTT